MNNGGSGNEFLLKQEESYFCVGMSTILCGRAKVNVNPRWQWNSQKGKSKGECKNQRVELIL